MSWIRNGGFSCRSVIDSEVKKMFSLLWSTQYIGTANCGLGVVPVWTGNSWHSSEPDFSNHVNLWLCQYLSWQDSSFFFFKCKKLIIELLSRYFKSRNVNCCRNVKHLASFTCIYANVFVSFNAFYMFLVYFVFVRYQPWRAFILFFFSFFFF